MAKRGPKSKYDPAFVELAYQLALKGVNGDGATDKEIADTIGVDEATLNRWKLEHPELCESIKKGKRPADAKVAASLYKRACGFEYEEIETVVRKTGNGGGEEGETGEKVITVKKVKKYVPPDTGACALWLKNRAGWRDKVDHELTGKDGERLFGVMVVPQGVSAEEWARQAAGQQAMLLTKKGNES